MCRRSGTGTNPNGDNVGYDSLSHSEVIKMSTEFIATEPTMQDILTSKYPILLIDESQDTKKELIDALLIVCEKYGEKFIVGMFGDTMQKIYNDGKDNLAIVAYTENEEMVRDTALANGWFLENEIYIV